MCADCKQRKSSQLWAVSVTQQVKYIQTYKHAYIHILTQYTHTFATYVYRLQAAQEQVSSLGSERDAALVKVKTAEEEKRKLASDMEAVSQVCVCVCM